LRETSPLTPEPDLERSLSTARSKQPKKKTAPTRPKQAAAQRPRKKTSANARSRKNADRDETWMSASQKRRKGKRPVISDESDDDVTEEDPFMSRMVGVESDGTIESLAFPTFVSASAVSGISESEDGSTSSVSDSFASDSSLRAEEEQLILSEEQRAKVRRELLKDEENWHMEKRKWDHLKNNNNWEIRPRKRSVGPEESASESESESESEMEVDEEEEEEGEGDEEDDPDIRYGHGLVTAWQSSDEDEDFDVEVFFATLTDSSGPGSDADAEDSGNETDGSDLSTISMSEAAAAGLFQTTDAPLVVTEDWDGRLVFADGLKDGQGVLDVHFEVSAAERQRSIREARELDMEVEAEEEFDEEEDHEDLIAEDDGETTDDMLDHDAPPGVPPIPFRFPTPPIASIDPLSTLSPVVTSKRNKFFGGIFVDAPNPADILANSNNCPSRSASVVPSPPGTSVSSFSQPRQPKMGVFTPPMTDPKKRAVLDGKNTVVSPFLRIRGIGRGRERKRVILGVSLQYMCIYLSYTDL